MLIATPVEYETDFAAFSVTGFQFAIMFALDTTVSQGALLADGNMMEFELRIVGTELLLLCCGELLRGSEVM